MITKDHGAKQEGLTEQQIIQEIVNKLRIKQITTQQIGKATVGAPTEAKQKAAQVEKGESTQDKKQEGEEIGDDN